MTIASEKINREKIPLRGFSLGRYPLRVLRQVINVRYAYRRIIREVCKPSARRCVGGLRKKGKPPTHLLPSARRCVGGLPFFCPRIYELMVMSAVPC